MPSITPFQTGHLFQTRELVNAHLGVVVPGWALPDAAIVDRMASNPAEFIVDPWATDRITLCAVEQQQVVAIVHLLHYGTGAEVSPDYRGAAELGWFLFWPDHGPAAFAILEVAIDQMRTWSATPLYANLNLPVPVFSGVPDVWPHIAEALELAGFTASAEPQEAVFAGTLHNIPLPGSPPVAGMTVRRRIDRWGSNFAAIVEEREVGWCECVPDLTHGGALPALGGWAELGEMHVEERWRSKGIGFWLVQHAAEWLRLAGCTRAVLIVSADDEGRGAGRFYNRFGWCCLTRLRKGWVRRRDLGSETVNK